MRPPVERSRRAWRWGTCDHGCGWRRSTTSPTRSTISWRAPGTAAQLTIGYFTKHGDGGVDVLPIGHLLKGEVRTLARGARRTATDHRQTAERRRVARSDGRGRHGCSYADLERYLSNGPEGVSPALALRLERMIRSTEHKRNLPPNARIVVGDTLPSIDRAILPLANISSTRASLGRRRYPVPTPRPIAAGVGSCTSGVTISPFSRRRAARTLCFSTGSVSSSNRLSSPSSECNCSAPTA